MWIYALHSWFYRDEIWLASSIENLVCLLEQDIKKAQRSAEKFENRDDLFVMDRARFIFHLKLLIKALTVDRPQGFLPGYFYSLPISGHYCCRLIIAKVS